MARKPKKNPNETFESVFNARVASMVAAGATVLSSKEWAEITATHDAHGCILIPKDATETPDSSDQADDTDA